MTRNNGTKAIQENIGNEAPGNEMASITAERKTRNNSTAAVPSRPGKVVYAISYSAGDI
jgi:hypothetical protein